MSGERLKRRTEWPAWKEGGGPCRCPWCPGRGKRSMFLYKGSREKVAFGERSTGPLNLRMYARCFTPTSGLGLSFSRASHLTFSGRVCFTEFCGREVFAGQNWVCIIHIMDSRGDYSFTFKRGWRWYLARSKGSHCQYKHPTKPGLVTVPHPKKDLPVCTVKSIFRQAGWKL